MKMTDRGLEELFDYKNQLMKDILTSERIVSLIKDGMTVDGAEALKYKLVFPYEFVPETVEYGETFICFDVDIQSVENKTYLHPVIYVWVFTHKSKMRLPEGGVRVDMLVSEIAKVLNGNRYYGLGELDLRSVKRFAPMTDFQGKYMVFDARDYNRLSPTGQKIPSNRKTGE